MEKQESIDTPEGRALLLAVARAAVQRALGVSNAEVAESPTDATPPGVVGEFGGAFVTLKVDGKLRGCVGSFAATRDLVRTIQEVTAASLADGRFASQRIQAAELDGLSIEISVLSSIQRVADPLSIELGKHGIVVMRGRASGCFLPQVATERGWTKEEFLSNCCTMKAGLPADAWLDRHTDVFTFTARVFAGS